MEIEFQRGAIDASGAVSQAWEQVKANYGTYLGVTLLTLVMTGCIPCFNLFLLGPVLGGVFYLALRDQRHEPIEFGMMFEGFKKFVPLMVIGLIQSIPAIIAQVLRFTVNMGQFGIDMNRGSGRTFNMMQNAASPDLSGLAAGGILIFAAIVGLVFALISIVWWALTFFAIPLAMEYDLDPITALKTSARAAMSNIGGLVVLVLIGMLVALIGLCLLCVGVFFVTMPIMYVSNALVYRQVFPYFSRSDGWSAPPPPNAYGY